MQKLIYCLMALALTACDKDWDCFSSQKIHLSHLTIECMCEEVALLPSTDDTYTQHTYICSGYVENYSGVCHIEIWSDSNDLLSNDCTIKAWGDNTSFGFSFTTKMAHLDHHNCNFKVMVYDNEGNKIYQTMVVAKHSDDTN